MGFSKDWKGAYIFPKLPKPHQFRNYTQPSRGPENLDLRLPLPSSGEVTTPPPQQDPVLIPSITPLLSQP